MCAFRYNFHVQSDRKKGQQNYHLLPLWIDKNRRRRRVFFSFVRSFVRFSGVIMSEIFYTFRLLSCQFIRSRIMVVCMHAYQFLWISKAHKANWIWCSRRARVCVCEICARCLSNFGIILQLITAIECCCRLRPSNLWKMVVYSVLGCERMTAQITHINSKKKPSSIYMVASLPHSLPLLLHRPLSLDIQRIYS